MRRQSFFCRTCQHLIWLLILLFLVAILMCILNSTNIIQGSWATALNGLFSGAGAILALLQWWAQIQPTNIAVTQQRISSENAAAHSSAQCITSKRKGAIVVYTPRIWRGVPIHLVSGLQENAIITAPIEAISTVVESRDVRTHMFVCSFPLIPPGHYTLVMPSKQCQGQLTFDPFRQLEMDPPIW